MKSQFLIKKALIAGIFGTIIMTLFMFMGSYMVINMNIPKMLGPMMGNNILIGWIIHFMIGIILAVTYGLFFDDKIIIHKSWIRGALFGIIPWLMAQLIVMPMMSYMNGMNFSSGIFSGSLSLSLASLMAHLIFGATVGFIYKSEEDRKANIQYT